MSRTILLADDSVTIQKVIELTFMEEDYDVLAVSDGDEALDKLGDVSPDIVIADVHMPGASGLDVCRRSKEIHPDIPVLLLIGTFEPFDEAESEAVGADAHLKKPFDSQELLQLVGELMSGSSSGAASEGESDLGAIDLSAAPDEASAEEGEALADAAAGDDADAEPAEGGVDWGFEAPAPGEAAAAVAEVSAGAETVKADLGELSWGDGSQLEVEAPPAIGQEEEPAPVWGVTAEAAPEALADDVSAGEGDAEDAAEDGDGDRAAAEPGESDWGFRMAQSVEDDADDSPAEAVVEAAADPAEDEGHEDVAVSFSAPDDLDSYGSADIEAAAYGGGEPSAEVAEPAGIGPVSGLSNEDVDRIARRVTELLSDRVAREVAWEVVPDLAEVVIRERLRELEGQLD